MIPAPQTTHAAGRSAAHSTHHTCTHAQHASGRCVWGWERGTAPTLCEHGKKRQLAARRPHLRHCALATAGETEEPGAALGAAAGSIVFHG